MRAPRSHRVTRDDATSFVAACFAGTPTRTFLEQLVSRNTDIVFVDDRMSLSPIVVRRHPAAVLVPTVDRHGVTTASLIARLRVDAPDVGVVVIAAATTSPSGLAAVIRAGARVFFFEDANDLGASLRRLRRRPASFSSRDRSALAALVADLTPEPLVHALLVSVEHAPSAMSVANFAARSGYSPRMLRQLTRTAGWPTPAELIEWGRLLRASLLQWRQSATMAGLAREAGFASAYSLARSARRRLGLPAVTSRDISPLQVSAGLRRRLATLAKHNVLQT